MAIAFDQEYAAEVGEHFGPYRATFISDNGQVTAHIFEQGDQLVAYVAFETGLDPSTTTDPYLQPLNVYAAQEGFAGKLALRYT